MHRNTKYCLIFLALLSVFGGVAVFSVIWLNYHKQHQPPVKRGIRGMHQRDFLGWKSSADVADIPYFGIEDSEFSHVYKSRYRNRHRSSDAEEDLGSPDSYFTSSSVTATTSSSVQPLATSHGNINPSVDSQVPATPHTSA
ncbi:hypothetical protein SBOR_3770 [Sclerotinia borealis F-4128]|uniref:Uncharacterized protein n=1 Tax=Sclerotinia borealis (strain F-4128) TaxID=1432307 RepID=W9CIM6_SCLBF|nr:hypothetical protein SBOR_3770 [Sclerotinia borealis F-4128]